MNKKQLSCLEAGIFGFFIAASASFAVFCLIYAIYDSGYSNGRTSVLCETNKVDRVLCHLRGFKTDEN